MISTHVCRHLLQSRRPKATKNAPLGQKIAKSSIIGQRGQVAIVEVLQEFLPVLLKNFWWCLGRVKFGAGESVNVVSEVLPANEGFATMPTGRFPINRISSYVQRGTLGM